MLKNSTKHTSGSDNLCIYILEYTYNVHTCEYTPRFILNLHIEFHLCQIFNAQTIDKIFSDIEFK